LNKSENKIIPFGAAIPGSDMCFFDVYVAAAFVFK
jgi:hypothetical protein